MMRFNRAADGLVYSVTPQPDEQIEVTGKFLAQVADGAVYPGVSVTASIEPFGSLAGLVWTSLTIQVPVWTATYDLDRPDDMFDYYLKRDTWRGILREASL